MLRKELIVNNEFYHIYNRGVDKRSVFEDRYDLERFYRSMMEFNSVQPIGGIFEHSFIKPLGNPIPKLVNFVAYCLNPNHFHFILEQLVDSGISKFMKRLGGGYTLYFNEKHDRTGALFQGKYRFKHINSNDYLLHLSAYVNLNYEVHQLGNPTSKLIKSSWAEYTKPPNQGGICQKDIILDQFKTLTEYKDFTKEALMFMQEKKKDDKEIKLLALE